MTLPRLPAALLALASLAITLPEARAAELTVEVTGAAVAGGRIEVSLFDSAENFMKEPYLQDYGVPDADGRLEVVFPAVAEGQYAVVAVHDENDNGELDSGFLGFGAEGYGFSNAAWTLFGWPGFEQAAFAVEGDLRIEVRLD